MNLFLFKYFVYTFNFNLVEESKDPIAENENSAIDIVEIENQESVDQTPIADSTNQVESVTEEKIEEIKEVVEEETVTATTAIVESEPVKEVAEVEGTFITNEFKFPKKLIHILSSSS